MRDRLEKSLNESVPKSVSYVDLVEPISPLRNDLLTLLLFFAFSALWIAGLRRAGSLLKAYMQFDRTACNRIWRQAARVFLMLRSISLIYAICCATAAFAQNRYQITRIPTAQGANSVALGINNNGEVVGYSFQGEDYQAFLYSSSDQSLTDVGSLGGKINAACAISDTGQVTGYSQDGNGNLLAFVFSRKQPIASLGTLDGASTSEAFGINHSGAVVGDSQSGKQNHRPVLFANGSVQDLGLGGSNEPDALETAYAINDAGQVVGRHSTGNNAFHAFVFVDGNTTDLRTLGGVNGEALAINKNGLAVGDSDTADGPAHAFVFDHSQLKDLGTLPGFDNASYARGINNSGDIVGESDSADQKRAFLYTKGRLVELDKLVGNLSEAGFNSLDVAYGINDKGWIVGYGSTSDNLTAAFVAVPEGRSKQSVPPQPQRLAQGQPVSESDEGDYDVFYNKLSSDEGSWVEAGDYGYCFRPRVSEDWRPYRDGHWVWTDRGWYWDSNERFAWATYHYGRWVDIGGTGWCWVPGDQWAPAWVSWRESDENVGWAPLPPEADFSANPSISSWSDSYYGIGPAAYVFINFSHWHEPSYAQYIEPPGRNVQIINETKNVTNIVTTNNVINNFGPPVQTVAARTNQNIQQVNLALSPATGPNANYGQTLQGNQLKVVAPPATLKPQGTLAPPVQSRIENPQVEKGWQGIKPQDAEKLKKTVAEQNPPPKDLPKPTPFVSSQVRNKAQVIGPPGATGSPPAVTGQKSPPNLLKPAAGSPNANVIPGASPNAAAAGKKSIPPNLLGVKPSGTPGGSPTGPGGNPTTPGSPELKQSPSRNVPGGSPNAPGASPSATAAGNKSVPANLLGAKPVGTPGASPTVQPSVTPGGSPTRVGEKPTTPGSAEPKQSPSGNVPAGSPSVPKGTPLNPNAPRPAATPDQPGLPANQPAVSPTPKPPGNSPDGQNTPHVPATPRPVATPAQEKKPETTPAPTAHGAPANLTTPKPTPEVKAAPQEIPTPKPTPAATPHEPVAAPKPTAEVKKAAPQEIPTPKPTPAAATPHEPAATPKPTPEVKAAPREISTPKSAPVSTPRPEPVAAPKPSPEKKATPQPKPEIKTPPPPQVQHTPTPQRRVVHTTPAQPQVQKVVHEARPAPPPPSHVAQAPRPPPPPHVAQAPHPPPPPHVAQAPRPPPPPPPRVAQAAPHPQPQPHPAANNKDQKKKNPPQR
jgi:probable HAF family extracellular repeat protein